MEVTKKQFHAHIKSKTKSKFPAGPIKQNGKTITDSKKIAEALNHYFLDSFHPRN